VTELVEILGRLVEADRAAGRSDTFVLIYTGGLNREIIGHAGWPEGMDAPTDVEVDDLADEGWVRINGRDGKGRQFAVAAAGRKAWDEHLRRLDPTPGTPVTLDWSSSGPMLHRIFEAYEAAGAPERGVHVPPLVEASDDPASAAAAARELVRDDWLEVVHGGQGDVPVLVRPSPKALRLEAGWPGSSADAAVNALVAALEREIAVTADPEKRSALVKVCDGLIGAARDFVVAYLAAKA
jgi:hypothetical protein